MFSNPFKQVWFAVSCAAQPRPDPVKLKATRSVMPPTVPQQSMTSATSLSTCGPHKQVFFGLPLCIRLCVYDYPRLNIIFKGRRTCHRIRLRNNTSNNDGAVSPSWELISNVSLLPAIRLKQRSFWNCQTCAS